MYAPQDCGCRDTFLKDFQVSAWICTLQISGVILHNASLNTLHITRSYKDLSIGWETSEYEFGFP
jgi:hypothetical protein